jgi:transposase
MLARMRAMSVAEQRYQAVLDVISEGRTVMDVAGQWGVNRRTVHRLLARYEADGLEGLPDRSHRPERCPHQMAAELEVLVLELRRTHRYWGARRLVLELVRRGITPAPSESAVYRCLVRAAVIDPVKRHRRKETWKRWERDGPMEVCRRHRARPRNVRSMKLRKVSRLSPTDQVLSLPPPHSHQLRPP